MDRRSELGSLLLQYRRAAGLTQRQLAERAQVSVGTLRDLEQGRTLAAREHTLTCLADALGLGSAERELLTSSAGPPRGSGGAAAARAPAWAEATGEVAVALLGPLTVWRDGQRLALRPMRLQAVLGLLLLSDGMTLSREAVLDALWGAEPPLTATQMLEGYVSRIRRLLRTSGAAGYHARAGQATLLSWDGTGYQLASGAVATDAAEFGTLIDRARLAARSDDHAVACAHYEQAMRLWRGTPLSGLSLLGSHPAVMRLGSQRTSAAIEYFEAARRTGNYDSVSAHLRSLAHDEPLDERIHAKMMIALSASGQQAAALRVYERLKRRLDDELGVSPCPELEEAHLRVLRQEPAGDRAGPVTANRVVPHQLPPTTRYFAGRARELAELNRMLGEADRERQAPLVAAIGGIGGVGKTALALYWAHSVAGRFPDGELYVNLRGYGPSGPPVTATDAAGTLLEGLGVPAERIPVGADARTGLYLSLVSGKKMIIVLDNARNSEQARPLLPASPGCLVLVTSRGQLAGLAAEGARGLDLRVLSQQDARTALAVRLGMNRVAAEPGACDDLISFCGRLPLALGVAAARAASHPRAPLASIAEELRDEGRRMDALGTDDAATDIRAVFSWSANLLSEGAARLFCLLGIYPGQEVSVQAAACLAGISQHGASRLLNELSRSGLLSEYIPWRFACHDLLHAYAAELASSRVPSAEQREASRRVFDYFLLSFHRAGRLIDPCRPSIALTVTEPAAVEATFTTLTAASAWCLSEAGMLGSVINAAGRLGFTSHAWQLAWAADAFFHRLARWDETAAVHKIALEAAQHANDRLGQAHMLSGLGRALIMIGPQEEAVRCLRQAVGLFQELGDRPGEASARIRDGVILSGLKGLHGEAYAEARRALELFRAAGCTGGHAAALINMGNHAAALGQQERAVTLCRQALEIYLELDDRRGQGMAHAGIAEACLRLGDFSRAQEHGRVATELLDTTGHIWELAGTLEILGDACSAAMDLGSALAAWERALDLVEPLTAVSEPACARIAGKVRAARTAQD